MRVTSRALAVSVVAVLLLVFNVPATLADSLPQCTQAQITAGLCNVSGSLTGDSAVLTGTQNGPGGRDSSGSSSTGSSTNTNTNTNTPAPPPPSCEFWGTVELDTCRALSVTSRPVPTLSDIAAFRPTPGVDHMEPDGWFVVGLDANFYATGGSSVVEGELFDNEAWVRFTPIRWQWFYGDGSSALKSSRGATWASQGIAEFDPTPTSHVYDLPGTYYIDLTIG